MKKKIAYCVFIAAFFVLCIIPSAGMLIWGESEAAANEMLAMRPVIMQEDGTFNENITDDVTSYFADRFAFRQQFITAYAKIHGAVFGESSSEDVILGEKGWLYYASTTDDYLNINTLQPREINSIAHTLSMMQQYAEDRGVKFAFTVAPNKNSVYPFWMPDIGDGSADPNNLEMLSEALTDKGVAYADLKEAFTDKITKTYASSDIASLNEPELYHRLDSHWNNLGAALGLKVITDTLGVNAHDWFSERHEIRYDFRGDLYEMLYPAGEEMDQNMYFDREFSFSYDEDHAGNIPKVDSIKISTVNENAEGSLLMFRDSFGNALYPFMADSFGEAVFSRLMPYRMDWLNEMDPDYLVIEIVERNISNLLEKAPVMPAPEVTLDQFPKGMSGSDIKAEAAVTESGTLAGYCEISGNFDISGVDEDTRVFLMVSSDDENAQIIPDAAQHSHGINRAIRFYEASPVGKADENGILAGRFTAYIPSEILNGNQLSVILCCGGNYEVAQVTVR